MKTGIAFIIFSSALVLGNSAFAQDMTEQNHSDMSACHMMMQAHHQQNAEMATPSSHNHQRDHQASADMPHEMTAEQHERCMAMMEQHGPHDMQNEANSQDENAHGAGHNHGPDHH